MIHIIGICGLKILNQIRRFGAVVYGGLHIHDMWFVVVRSIGVFEVFFTTWICETC